MTDEKIDRLNDSKVPWLEIRVNQQFVNGENRWTGETPLKIWRSSEDFGSKRWICHECINGLQNLLVFRRLSAIVDIYGRLGTKGGSGIMQRKTFSLLSDKSKKSFYLIEGGFTFINDVYKYEQLGELLSTSNSVEDLEIIFRKRIKRLQEQNLVDIIFDWPGDDPALIFNQDSVYDERLRVASLPSELNAALDRYFPLRYAWKAEDGLWKQKSKIMMT